MSEDEPPPKGVYWIDENEYGAVRDVFEDGNALPATWKGWLKMAEEMRRGLEAYGHVVMRVWIHPEQFRDWCSKVGVGTGREARKKFVADAVKERYGDQT